MRKRLSKEQRKRVQRLLTLTQYHNEQADAMRREMATFLNLALGVDIINEAWTLDVDAGVLTKDEEHGA